MAKDKEFIILGAGITGLSTAVELDKKGEKSIIIEKDKEVGGLCKSFHQNGCTLDLGPHKLYSQLPGIMEYFKDVLKDDCLTVKKTNSIFLLDKKINFPINISNLISCVSPKTVITGTKAGFSFAGQTAKAVLAKNKIHTYEDWFINGFGKAGYNLVFRDYAWKVWGDPKTLSWELGKKRVPISGLFGFVKNMLSKKEKAKISAEFFYYPKQGMGEFCEKLYKDIKKNNEVILNATPKEIIVKNNKAESIIYNCKNKNTKISNPKYIISTIPVPQLISMITPSPSKRVIDAAKALKCNSIILVHIFIEKEKILSDNWVFFPEKEYVFNRVSEQNSFSKFTCKQGVSVICAEITSPKDKGVYNLSDSDIIERVFFDLRKTKILFDDKILDIKITKLDNVYPIYDLDYKKNMDLILEYIDSIDNLISIGRYGLFNYNNMDHCIDMAKKTTDFIVNQKPKQEWKKLRTIFDNYKIVD